MNKQANKCRHCRKSLPAIKINQKFCSAACRQADYRKRKTQARKPNKQAMQREKQPQATQRRDAICEHCGGVFWVKKEGARFCSTSCRTMYHRALRAGLADVLVAGWGNMAADWIDTKPIKQLRVLVESHGYVYHHDQRRWVQRLEMEVRGR